MSVIKVKDKEFVPYLTSESIQKRIDELAKVINAEYEGKDPLFIGVLNGAFMFASDLLQKVNCSCQITFVKMASYQGTTSTGSVKELLGLRESIEGKHVIILEDIVDTGLTMSKAIADLSKQNPASLEIATLLLKPDSLTIDLEVKYVGFEIPDKFVVGYGLDYDGYGRNLQDIYQLKND